MAGSPSPGDPVRRRFDGLAAFVAYAAVSFLFFGLTLFVEPGSRYAGPKADPQLFIWLFAWWPHAISHGQNPIVTDMVWAPSGMDLTWTTSVPGLALIFSPLTWLFGPVASYNAAAVLMPALAAWTGFLLCRHLTRAFWPSLTGGYLFGFSSYMLSQQLGHLQMTSVFLVPLIALVVLRYVRGELGGHGLALRLGPLVALQLLFSTEVSMTVLLALGAAWLLGLWLVPDRRARLVSLVVPVAGGYALAALVDAPFVYFALKDAHTGEYNPPQAYSADLLNYIVPTSLTWYARGGLAQIATHFPANIAERGAYLGLPTLAIILLYARRARRSQGSRFLLAFCAVAAFFALGSKLYVYGHALIPLPWSIVDGLPVWNNLLPVRFALYTSLAAGAITALWMASQPAGRLRWLLPAIAVLSIVPDFAFDRWSTSYSVAPFFTDGTYRSCLTPGEIVLPLPIGQFGDEMLWQVRADYRFRMAGGRVTATPPTQFMHPPSIETVSTGSAIPPRQAALLAGYVKTKDVGAVIVDAGQSSAWTGALDRLAKPQAIGGVIVYDMTGSGRRCTS